MPQVASETPVQSHSLPPARANSARPGHASAAASPFASLIDDSLPPPDQGPTSRTASQEAATEPPPQSQADSKPAQPAHEGKKTADKSTAADKGAADQKTDAKADSKTTEAPKTDAPDTTDETVKLDPLPADGETKETDKADTAGTENTAKTDTTAKPANTATPTAPDPTVGQNAAQQSPPTPQVQTQATAAAVATAAVQTAQDATSPDQTTNEGDGATPQAKSPSTVLTALENSRGPAAKQGAPSAQPTQAAPQAQTPETQGPTVETANAKPAPASETTEKAADQKPAAAARGEASTNVQRFTLPETSGNAAANAQNTATPSASNAAQALSVATAASQPATHATANTPAAPAPQAPAAPVSPAGIAVTIAARASAGKNDFSIRLDPPELGRVDVRLSVDKDGQITSHLVADRRDTLALLQRDASGLQRALQDAGFKTADNGLQFSLRDSSTGEQQQQQSNGGTAGHVVLNDEMPAADAIASGYGRTLGRVGGVDIRV